ncbi:MAG TPA: helix-turn-helix transcriptional regulator [Humisphaera sp.]
MASSNGSITLVDAPAVAGDKRRPRAAVPRVRRPISPKPGRAVIADTTKARRALATFCRLRLVAEGGTDKGTVAPTAEATNAAAAAAQPTPPIPPAGVPRALVPALAPRVRQTLDGLLRGDSEKQIAHRLGLSKHTVHVYVKALYRRLNVSSRGELFAQFLRAG